MNRETVEQLLESVRRGDVDVAEAASQLAGVLPGMHDRTGPVTHLDHHRALRCGFPEVVFGEAKTPTDLVAIARGILERSDTLLVTRADAERAKALEAALPDAEYHERARCVTVRRGEQPEGRSGVMIVTAGTGDVPVAEEARVTAEMMGQAPEALHDVGVAGIHRVLGESERLRKARVVIVAAGMEGALPSVVGGLVGVPVIAVPTSVGYGLSLDGLAPLLGMMNACAPNVCVVNIDNGFGAGYLASLVNQPS